MKLSDISRGRNKKPRRSITGLILMALGTALLFNYFFSAPTRATEVSLDQFMTNVLESEGLQEVSIKKNGDIIIATFSDEQPWKDSDDKEYIIVKSSYTDGYEGSLTEVLLEKNIKFEVVNDGGGFLSVFFGLIPFLLFVGILFLVFKKSSNASGGIFNFGKSKSNILIEKPKVTFADVAGINEAVANMKEVKDFLSNSEKFRKMGARIPKGIMLIGPPGTGKTLLAKAVAGEAGVPFMSVDAPSFVEMFVGVGASRVRDMFSKIRAVAPAILFIDEIDAVGRSRGYGIGGGNDEREQALNQLLIGLDGFDENDKIVVMAATNRPDILDPALLRPGRFDRKVVVGTPDKYGRVEIFKVHMRGKPISSEVDVKVLAASVAGATGADIASIVNEAILIAVSEDASLVTMAHFEKAIDKVAAGDARPTSIMSEDEKRVVAYHETGHALSAYLLEDGDSVRKLSIVPRGLSLGHTQILPEEGSGELLAFKRGLFANMVSLMGGRVAEEIINPGNPSTGPSNDLSVATGIADAMVVRYAMSEDKLGYLTYDDSPGQVFLGRDLQMKHVSEETTALIDAEKRRFVSNARNIAFGLLKDHEEAIDAMVGILLVEETISGDRIEEIFSSAGATKDSYTLTDNLEGVVKV